MSPCTDTNLKKKNIHFPRLHLYTLLVSNLYTYITSISILTTIYISCDLKCGGYEKVISNLFIFLNINACDASSENFLHSIHEKSLVLFFTFV